MGLVPVQADNKGIPALPGICENFSDGSSERNR